MVFIDTSAWIEFLRGSESPVCTRVDELLGAEIAISDTVRMEVFAGARDEQHLSDLRRLLARATLVQTESIDYEQAASLYRVCRRAGETVRSVVDCLIAAVAIRVGAPVLHFDRDFDVLSRNTALRISSLD
jgi:predicted nucleic acid-binding protein